MNQLKLLNTVSWIGVALVLGAYALLSFGIIDASYLFQIPTGIGSLAVAITSWYKKDHQPAILNFIFAAIACIAIFRLLFIP